MNNKSTKEKVLMGLGIGLASANGNQAAGQMVMNAINADIEAQKEEIEREYKILSMKKDMLGTSSKLAKEGPPNVRLLNSKIKLLNVAIDQTERLAARPGANPQNAQKMLSQLQAERDLVADTLADTIQNSNGKIQLSDDQVDKNTGAQYLTEKQQDRFVPGYGLATNKESATEFRKAKTSNETALNSLKQVIDLSEKGSRLNPKDRAELSTQLAMTIGKLREPLLGPGSMQEKEYERLKEAIGDPNKILALPENERSRLKVIMKNLQSDLNIQARNAGLPAPKTDFSSIKKSK